MARGIVFSSLLPFFRLWSYLSNGDCSSVTGRSNRIFPLLTRVLKYCKDILIMSTISATEAPHLQQIDLTKLSIPQLGQLKKQLDRELTVFQDSLQTLKIAQSKFQESGSCLDKITPETEGKEVLVPLTDSMYVQGKMGDTETVLVDIGTGYFVEKNIEDAKDYFKRRVIYVTEQMEKIQLLGLEKSKIRDATMDVIGMKIQSSMPEEGAERA